MNPDFANPYPMPPPRIWGNQTKIQTELSPADLPDLRYDLEEVRKRQPDLILRSRLLSCARFTDNVDRPESSVAIELRLVDRDLFRKEVVNNKLRVDFHVPGYDWEARGMELLKNLGLDYIACSSQSCVV
jgi:hypothetical protein